MMEDDYYSSETVLRPALFAMMIFTVVNQKIEPKNQNRLYLRNYRFPIRSSLIYAISLSLESCSS